MKPIDRSYGPARDPVNLCAQCGETIYMASWSEYVDDRRIKYLWECDSCGYTFESLVAFAEPRFDQAA